MNGNVRVRHEADERIAGFVNDRAKIQRHALSRAGRERKLERLERHVGRVVVRLAADAQFTFEFRRRGNVHEISHLGHRPGGNGQHHGAGEIQCARFAARLEFAQTQLAARGERGVVDEIRWVIQRDAGNVLPELDEFALQFRDVRPRREVARVQLMLLAQRRRHADGLAAVRARRHDARRTERDVRRADDATGEKKIFYVAAVKAAIRDLIDAFGMPLLAAGFFAEHAVARMQINRPAAERNGVGMLALLDQVLLDDHVVALEAAAFAFAGNRADPFEC